MTTNTTTPKAEWGWWIALAAGTAFAAGVGWLAYSTVVLIVKAGGGTALVVILAGAMLSLSIVGFSLHLLQRDSTETSAAPGSEEGKTISLRAATTEPQTETVPPLKKAA